MSWVKGTVRTLKAVVDARRPTWVQDTLALVVVGAVVWLAVTGRPVPEILSGIAWLIIGFFFGSTKRPSPALGELAVAADGTITRRRTRHGKERSRTVHFQCVHPSRDVEPLVSSRGD